jgi:hypothetical protein
MPFKLDKIRRFSAQVFVKLHEPDKLLSINRTPNGLNKCFRSRIGLIGK